MSRFKSISAEQLKENPFQLIGKDWMLVTAKKGDKVNTMTASWGGLGVMWRKNVAFLVIRPGRYTKEFIDASDTLSLTFFNDTYKKQLSYLGAVSGRDEDKIHNTNLTVAHHNDTPYFEEGRLVLICKKLFSMDMKQNNYIVPGYPEEFYKADDWHNMYIVEITDVLLKEEN